MKIERGGKVRVDTCNLFFNLYQPPATLSEVWFLRNQSRVICYHMSPPLARADRKSDDRHGRGTDGARMGLEKESSAHIGTEHP